MSKAKLNWFIINDLEFNFPQNLTKSIIHLESMKLLLFSLPFLESHEEAPTFLLATCEMCIIWCEWNQIHSGVRQNVVHLTSAKQQLNHVLLCFAYAVCSCHWCLSSAVGTIYCKTNLFPNAVQSYQKNTSLHLTDNNIGWHNEWCSVMPIQSLFLVLSLVRIVCLQKHTLSNT